MFIISRYVKILEGRFHEKWTIIPLNPIKNNKIPSKTTCQPSPHHFSHAHIAKVTFGDLADLDFAKARGKHIWDSSCLVSCYLGLVKLL